MKKLIAISLFAISALLSGCSGAKGDIEHTLNGFFNGIKAQNSTQVVNAIDVPPPLQAQAGMVVQAVMMRLNKVEGYEIQDIKFFDDNESANVSVKVKFRTRESTLPLNMHKTDAGWKLDINQGM